MANGDIPDLTQTLRQECPHSPLNVSPLTGDARKLDYSLGLSERDFQIQPARNPETPPTIAAVSILTCPEFTIVPTMPPRAAPKIARETILLLFIILIIPSTLWLPATMVEVPSAD